MGKAKAAGGKGGKGKGDSRGRAMIWEIPS